MNSSIVSFSSGSADDGKDNEISPHDLEGEAGKDEPELMPESEPEEEPVEPPLNRQHFDHVLTFNDLKISSNHLIGASGPPVIRFEALKTSVANTVIDAQAVDSLRLHEETERLVAGLGPQMIKQMVEARDADLITHAIYHPFHELFMRHLRGHLGWPTFKLKALMHVILHRVVCEFIEESSTRDKSIPSWLLLCGICARRKIEKTLLQEKQEASEFLQSMAIKTYREHRDKFASPTRHKEDDELLTAPEKARVFMNALRERNAAGACVQWKRKDADGVVTEIGLKFIPRIVLYHHHDEISIKDLFERYPRLSVSKLLRILDWCLQVHGEEINGTAGDRPEKFYPLKGCNIAFFCRHLKTIVEKLNLRYCIKLRLP